MGARAAIPAPGVRYYDTGVLNNVSHGGYSWSSTSYDSGDRYRALYLNFGATWFDTSYASSRAYGFQLRCLSE